MWKKQSYATWIQIALQFIDCDDKKVKAIKKYVIKHEIKFEDCKNC